MSRSGWFEFMPVGHVEVEPMTSHPFVQSAGGSYMLFYHDCCEQRCEWCCLAVGEVMRS